MARPKKENVLKRNHRIYLRLTDTEYEILSTNAEAANLPLAKFVRKQLMDKKVTVNYEIVASVPELKKLIAEFGKIGSNLNQIARYFNSGGIHSKEVRKAIDGNLANLYEMKAEVLKMAGNFLSTTDKTTAASKGGSHGNPEAHRQ